MGSERDCERTREWFHGNRTKKINFRIFFIPLDLPFTSADFVVSSIPK